MTRSSRLAAAGTALLMMLFAVTLPAEEPARQAAAVKPPWQRYLQGEDARKAAEQEKQLAQWQEAGKFAEALKAAEALVELRARVQGTDHWQTANARSEVTALQRLLRQGQEQQKEYLRTFALERDAQQKARQGHYNEAQPLLEKALAVRVELLGEEHLFTALSYNSLALNQAAQGKYAEAETNYRKALAIFRKVLGEEHPNTATGHGNVASNLDDRGKHREAEEGHRKALSLERRLFGEDNARTATRYSNLGLNLNAQGKYREAEVELLRALAIRRKLFGEQHLDVAASQDNLAVNLQAQGKLAEAEASYRKALAICRALLGEQHPRTALSFNNLAVNLEAQGKYAEAETNLGKALAIFRKVLGEEHPSTATLYHNLASLLQHQGKYEEAAANARKALSIRRKVLGNTHPHVANSLDVLASTCDALGKYADAEALYRESLALRRKVLGEEHPHVALSHNNLATNLNAQGKYDQAEQSARRALEIWRKRLGEEHPLTVLGYGNVASSLDERGHYREAEEIHRKTLQLRRRLLGDDHADTAVSYNNLAVNLNAQGRFAEAQECYRKALLIRLKVLGEEHAVTATSYNNLAYNQDRQGKHVEAEQSYRRALAISRKTLGEEHPQTATNYNNLAGSLQSQGKYEEAGENYQKALEMRRRLLGEEHPHTALSYNNVAANWNGRREYQKAEEAYRRSLAINRKVPGFGEEHPATARSYNNLAVNLHEQGKYAEAEPYLLRALAIWRKMLGEDHFDTALCHHNLAVNWHARGKYGEAEQHWRRAAEGFAKIRLNAAAAGLDRATLASEQTPLPFLAGVLARNGKTSEAWHVFEESLARGTLDDLTARLQRPQAERDRQAQIAARIYHLSRRLESTSAAQTTPEQRGEWLSQLGQAYDDLAAFTRQLEQKYGPVAGQVLPRDRIQKELPSDAALIAWLDIPGRPGAADANGEHWAILLRSSGDPVWVRLKGSGKDGAWTDADTQLPVRLRDALQSPGKDWRALAGRLRKQRLDPLVPNLKGVQRLIVLPSTALAGVPVEVMAAEYVVSYAHSASTYAHLRAQPAPAHKGLLALADPVFRTSPPVERPLPSRGVLVILVSPGSNAFRAGLKANDVLLSYGDTNLEEPADLKPIPEGGDPEQRVPVVVWRDGQERKQPFFVRRGPLGVVLAKQAAPQALAAQRRLDQLMAPRGGDWKELPGTRLEAAALQRLFGASARLLLRSEASEQRLDQLAASGELRKYRYLHLATHGEVNDRVPLRSAVVLSRDHLPDDRQRTELLLAGQPIPDGHLTAEEVLQRWKLDCDLVTLSACRTALGKYERGEGHVGFAHALILCGSRSVCLSLWKVDDMATALLMERFYQNLLGKREGLSKPMGKAEALAEAKKWLSALTREQVLKHAAALTAGVERSDGDASLLSRTKEPRPFAHPKYWAAFVLIGHAD